MPFTNREFYFPCNLNGLFPLSSLIAVIRTLKPILNKSGKNGLPFFFLICKRNAFQLLSMVAVGLSSTFIMLRNVSGWLAMGTGDPDVGISPLGGAR